MSSILRSKVFGPGYYRYQLTKDEILVTPVPKSERFAHDVVEVKATTTAKRYFISTSSGVTVHACKESETEYDPDARFRD